MYKKIKRLESFLKRKLSIIEIEQFERINSLERINYKVLIDLLKYNPNDKNLFRRYILIRKRYKSIQNIKRFKYLYGKFWEQKWNIFLKKKKRTYRPPNLETMISKYGKINGTKKYKKIIEKISFTSSKKYFKEKYGDKFDEYWKNRTKNFNTKHEFWLTKGFSLEEAKEKIRERNKTFSKNICIKKYGKNEGLKIWENRQKKWQNTLNKKSKKEKERINSLKGPNIENFKRKYGEVEGEKHFNSYWKNYLTKKEKNISKQEIIFILSLLKTLKKEKDDKNILYGKEQYFLRNENKIFFYDLVFLKEKIIVEYNGIHIHPKPHVNLKEWKHAYTKESAILCLKKEKIKTETAKKLGFKVFCIYSDFNENDYKKLVNDLRKELK